MTTAVVNPNLAAGATCTTHRFELAGLGRAILYSITSNGASTIGEPRERRR
jgi:hypothetical protein